MPLLKKKTLDKVPMPEFLRDDEYVFHCEMTNEIFRDYEEFAERTLLCNSMVWTCSMTGKTNLTYEEAAASEDNARKMLAEFPKEIKTPILLIATFTRRRYFGDAADDVFLYTKDRYFIGENVEACFHGNRWDSYKIIQVIPPTKDEINKHNTKSGDKNPNPSGTLYKYNLEQLSPDDEDVSEILIANMNMVRRKKNMFSREKVKLFLKQCVEHNDDGYISIKQSAIEDYGIGKLVFSDIFDGIEPIFDVSKKGKALPAKKTKQETLAKFLSKNNIMEQISVTNGEQNRTFIKGLTKEQVQEKKLLEKEKKAKEKEILKQKNMEIASQLKEFYRQKEDLVLENQKELPIVGELKSKIPENLISSALYIVEFVNTFASVLRTFDYFPVEFNFAEMEIALFDQTLSGPFQDILLLLLESLYSLQDEEINRLKLTEKYSPLSELDALDLSKEKISLATGTELASISQTWCFQHYGKHLKWLALNTLTLSEILRLHLLTSGSNSLTEYGDKLRASNRGGFGCEDDPAVHFRLHNSYIIEALSLHNVVQLPIGDKLKVLECLVNQLLTHKEIRDIINKQRDNVSDNKDQIKTLKAKQKRLLMEYQSEKTRIRRLGATKAADEIKKEMEKLETEHELKRKDDEFELNKLYESSLYGLNNLGYDRAFRRYIKLDSLPAILINDEEPNCGKCLLTPVKQIPELINANRDIILKHIHEMNAIRDKENNIKEELNSSDKENEPKEGSYNKSNGKMETDEDNSDTETAHNRLNMCTGNPKTCGIHGTAPKTKWQFLSEVSQFDELCAALNDRGIREGELLSTLNVGAQFLKTKIKNTPRLDNIEERMKKKRIKDSKPEEVTTTLHTELKESIMNLEQKVYECNIGGIKKNRSFWLKCMKENQYDQIKIEELGVSDEVLSYSRYGTGNDFIEPGKFLPRMNMEVESEDLDTTLGDIVLFQSMDDKKIIKHLSLALLTVATTIHLQYLKKPFGELDLKGKEKETILSTNVIPFWSKSLMNCTSYSQIFLHYATFYNSVAWRKTESLKNNCALCLKGNEPEKILLCDSCNKGYHMFCLKPKLQQIPKGDWFCNRCVQDERHEQNYGNKNGIQHEESEEEDNSSVSSFTNGESNELSYCVVCNEIESNSMLRCCECPKVFHFECHVPPLRRMPRGKWTCRKCKSPNTDPDESVQEITRRSSRVRDEAKNLPLHNVALQELLSDIMKHEDAWPFIRPVLKLEVPDYYDIITKPMDFGTIKYKLNMGNYKYDEEFMDDARLIFDNCNTYNNSDDDVYKCGVTLGKYFMKRCGELSLQLPESIGDMLLVEPKPKRRKR